MTDGPAGPVEADEDPAVTVVDELHRRVSRRGPDGREIEVLAARRGVTMRPGSAARVSRVRRFAPPRLHKEVLPRGVEPEARMLELLDLYAPPPSGEGGPGSV